MSESVIMTMISHAVTQLSDFVKNGSGIFLDDNTTSSPMNDVLRYTLYTVVVCIMSTFLWRRYYETASDPDSKLPLPPGSMGYPLVGESLSLIANGADYYLSRRKRYGKVFKTHILGLPTVRVMGAENIRGILMGEHMTVESSWPTSTKSLMGPGSLMNSSPEDHKVRKKLLLQALSPNVVASHVPQIQELVHRNLVEWCSQREQLGYDICRRLTISLATNILVGFRMENNEMKALLGEFASFCKNLFSLPWNIPGSGLSKGLKARENIIGEIKKRLLDKISDLSLVDQLKKLDQTSVSLTADEMADAILELWFAGTDTTASTSCSALLALGRDARVRGEIEEELSQYGLMEPEAELTFDLLTKLTYVENVVKEVLRMMPPAGGGFRRVKKTLEIGGYQIPKGWTVIYSIRDTHQITEIFDKREAFLPERWPEMDEKTREFGHKFHYLPFGAGARSCPGEKFAKIFVKIFIVELIRTVNWDLKNKNPKIRYLPITHPSDRLPVTFTLRNSAKP